MLAITLLALTAAANPLELKDGDRVVWIGSTVAEREQKYGHWETALLMKFADRKITLRNLGWSGDTVDGIARASFDKPEKGYERLIAKTKELKPTVIFVSYGSVEALAQKPGDDFEKQFEKLIADLNDTKARFVLFAPTPLEPDGVTGPRGGGRPSAEQMRPWSVQSMGRSVGAVAERGGHHFADLHTQLINHMPESKKANGYSFTDNGLHLSDAGYEATIPDLFATLGLSWEGADPKKYEAVRQAVIKKNELFFHQWRPQNETYLFGFRKHEQGVNAKDIPAFEPLIEKAEAEIRDQLKK